jgi:hypothetical protein
MHVISAGFSARHSLFFVTVCTASHQRRLYPHLHYPDRGSEMTAVGWPKSRWPKPAPTENNKHQHLIHLPSYNHKKYIDVPLNQLHPFQEVLKPINDMSVVKRYPKEEEWIPGENDTVAVDITYCNPDAKVVLISSDKVEMRVDAWLMSRQRYGKPFMTRDNAYLSVNLYEA